MCTPATFELKKEKMYIFVVPRQFSLCGAWASGLGGARTMEIGPIRNQNMHSPASSENENLRGTTKNKNHLHQPTIKFTRFLPINFLPLPAPP